MGFVASLKEFVGFFAVVKSDLAIAQDRMQQLGDSGPMKSHFRVLKQAGQQLLNATETFTKHGPTINADLGAVKCFLERKGMNPNSAAMNWLRKPQRGSSSWVAKLGELIADCRHFASGIRRGLGDGILQQITAEVPAAMPKAKRQRKALTDDE